MVLHYVLIVIVLVNMVHFIILMEQKIIQKKIANLARTIFEENKKIFVVHGRNINMRDKVCATLGRLKLDYVVLESEHNTGATVVEKFLRNAKDCHYAIVLFSADDIGKLNDSNAIFKSRTRQNVILELGFFLCLLKIEYHQ